MADNIVDIDLGGTARMLQRAEDALTDTSALMQDLAEVLLSGVEDNIRQQEGPGGEPWAQLAASTIEDRKEEGHWPGKILMRSGSYVSSFQAFSSATEAGASTNKPQALLLNFGGESDMPPGPAAVPPRPHIYISQDTSDEVDATIDDHLDEIR